MLSVLSGMVLILAPAAEVNVWSKTTRKQELADALSLAMKLRSKTVAPVLAQHIAYTPFQDHELSRPAPKEVQYPAYAVLKQTGLPAVQALLDQLKSTDYRENRKENGRQKFMLLVLCIRDIYDEGGHGKALARRRIEIEIEKALDKDKNTLN